MEELLWVSGLHRPMRSIYAATMGRQAAAAQNKMRQFFGTIIKPGALVFDIGANMGVFSAVFASVGAQVVALEPNADCVRHIQLSYGDKKIQVIQAAAGDVNDLAVLNMSGECDALSSVSKEWMTAVEEANQNHHAVWTKRTLVVMLTLDTLIARFGKPQYIKIDVEGFEEAVLAGLSTQPQILSFEFHANFLHAAMRCLSMDLFAAGSTFNFVKDAEWGYPARFELETWASKTTLEKALTELKGTESQGDIFVKA